MVDFALTGQLGRCTMSLRADNSLANNVLLSFLVRRGSFFLLPLFGSRLYLIRKITASNLELCRDYAVEALQWLIDCGRLKSINVLVVAPKSPVGRIELTVSVTKADGFVDTFTYFHEVV